VELLPVWYNVSSPKVVWDFDLSGERRDLFVDTALHPYESRKPKTSSCFVDKENVSGDLERSNISLSRHGATPNEFSQSGLNWKKPFVNEDVSVCNSKGLEYVRRISSISSIQEIPKEGPGDRNYLNEDLNSNVIDKSSLSNEEYDDNNTSSDANLPSYDTSTVDCDKEISQSEFKLPASKCPIMEATAFCAIKNWGISVAASSPNEVVFSVTDFDQYYKISRSICSKQHPTEDIGSRVKSLRRWFSSFPKKKERKENPHFELRVKQSGAKKVHEMIEKNLRLLGIQKLRRKL
jgi:hypothetical protein